MISGRTVEDIAAGKPAPASRRASRRRSGRAKDAFPGFVPPALATLKPQAAAGRRLGARDQVRRLSAAGADPGRRGEAADAERAGLDASASARRSRRRSRRCRPRRRSSTASWWSRARAARRTSRRCRPISRPGAATGSGSISSICSISTVRICARAAVAAQGAAGGAARRRGRAAALQRAFRRGRRDDAATMPAGSASRASSPSGCDGGLSGRADRSLDQVEMRRPAGVRDRGLGALDRGREAVGSLVLGV